MLTSYSLYSGTACTRPADRNASSATTANRRYSPAICQHGHDTSTTTITQPVPATARSDAEHAGLTHTPTVPIPAAYGPATYGPATHGDPDDWRHGSVPSSQPVCYA